IELFEMTALVQKSRMHSETFTRILRRVGQADCACENISQCLDAQAFPSCLSHAVNEAVLVMNILALETTFVTGNGSGDVAFQFSNFPFTIAGRRRHREATYHLCACRSHRRRCRNVALRKDVFGFSLTLKSAPRERSDQVLAPGASAGNDLLRNSV